MQIDAEQAANPVLTRWLGYGARCLAPALMLAAAACSPSLNWRNATLDGLRFSLPCKPDTAERPVVLDGHSLSMAMAGCQADGALFAVSRIALPPGTEAAPLLLQWRQATLARMQAGPATERTLPASAQGSPAMVIYAASGRNPQGEPVQAQLVWLQSGTTLFHLALYASRISAEMQEPFLSAVQLP